jgi:hypothetical protein
MFGVARLSLLTRNGAVWMLGSDKIDEFPITFLRHNKEYIQDMAEGYDLLVNYVDSRNKKSIRWLKWLGFEIFPAEPAGILGIPFHRFEKRVS